MGMLQLLIVKIMLLIGTLQQLIGRIQMLIWSTDLLPIKLNVNDYTSTVNRYDEIVNKLQQLDGIFYAYVLVGRAMVCLWMQLLKCMPILFCDLFGVLMQGEGSKMIYNY